MLFEAFDLPSILPRTGSLVKPLDSPETFLTLSLRRHAIASLKRPNLCLAVVRSVEQLAIRESRFWRPHESQTNPLRRYSPLQFQLKLMIQLA